MACFFFLPGALPGAWGKGLGFLDFLGSGTEEAMGSATWPGARRGLRDGWMVLLALLGGREIVSESRLRLGAIVGDVLLCRSVAVVLMVEFCAELLR